MTELAATPVAEASPRAAGEHPCPKPSVMFVDDEPHVLDGLRRSLRAQRKLWTLQFCTSGEQALQSIAEAPCDVVVSDMRMPGMDGAELLSRLSRVAPGAVRVVLSGHTQEEAGARAALVAHRFLSKPCDTGALIELVGQVTSGLGRTDAAARAAAGAVWRLPVRAQQLRRLREVVATPDVSQSAVVDAVLDSIWVAAKLLQLGSSRFFGSGTSVVSVADCVNALGAPFIGSLLDADPDLWAEPDDAATDVVDATYRHCLASSRLARRLAPPEIAPYCKMAGLLQGVGRLALTVGPEPGPGSAGAGADVVGRNLLDLWGLPPAVVRAVADKDAVHRPVADGLGVGGTLRAARLLLQETGCADPHHDAHPEELAELLSHPQLAAAGVDWRAEASGVARQVVQDLS